MYIEQNPKTDLVFHGEKGHRFSVMRLASFHHSSRFASCSFDGTVRIWKDNNQEKVLFFFSEAIEGLEITPDDTKIIIVLADSSKAFIYSLEEEKIFQIGEGRDLVIRNLFGTNMSTTKTVFVTFDDNVYIYDHKTKKLSTKLYIENLSGDSLVWINDDIFAIPKRNGNVVLVKSDNSFLNIIDEITIHDGLITSICRDGNNIVTVSEDGTGKILDLKFSPQFGFKINFIPLSVTYNDQNGIVAISGDRNLLIVKTITGEISIYEQTLSGCNPLITKDSKIIKGTGENDISFFSLNGEILYQIKGHSLTAEFVAFLDNDRLILASGDKKVHSLSYKTREDQILATHQESISSVLFVPSQNYIISGAYDDTIIIWDYTNQRKINHIENVPLVTTIALSPSGDIFIAGCSGDNTIHVFNLKGEKITSWVAHNEFIGSVLFMNDEVIISGSDDLHLKFWKRDGKLISSIKTNSQIKSIETTLEFDYNITGHLNGDVSFWDKITNQKVANYNSGSPIQRIKIMNNDYVLFAAQNELFLMHLDGFHIIDVKKICTHTEPIKGINWIEKHEKIVTIDHSIEIRETEFIIEREVSLISSEEVMEDEEPSIITFAPEVITKEAEESLSESNYVIEGKPSLSIDELHKISDYLNAVSNQLQEVVFPKLKDTKIDTIELEKSFNKVYQDVKNLIIEQKEDLQTIEKINNQKSASEDKKDWKSIDWGKRRH